MNKEISAKDIKYVEIHRISDANERKHDDENHTVFWGRDHIGLRDHFVSICSQ